VSSAFETTAKENAEAEEERRKAGNKDMPPRE
jgi:hypothetical protein